MEFLQVTNYTHAYIKYKLIINEISVYISSYEMKIYITFIILKLRRYRRQDLKTRPPYLI